MNRTIRHITIAADENLRRCRGGVVAVWNESKTIELTMTVRESKKMQRDHFIDIDDTVSDELMGSLLHSFRDDGVLLDEEAMRI